jgi:hypothetical protein
MYGLKPVPFKGRLLVASEVAIKRVEITKSPTLSEKLRK